MSSGAGSYDVAVAGTGLHAFGRFEGLSVTELGTSAVRAALLDAELAHSGFDAAFCASVYSGVAAAHKVLGSLGMTGMPIYTVEAGCASGGAALSLAADSIRAGRHETVLVFGMEKMPRGVIRSSFFEPWREEAGLAATPAYFALRARRLMETSGVTRGHLAEVSVKNHDNGVHNPNAMYREAVTSKQVLESTMVCDPLTLFMLCSPNEGAAALVLRRASGDDGEIRLAAAEVRSHLPGGVLGEATPLAGLVDDEIPAPTTLAADAAYEAAGVGPGDLDVVECQDTDSARELLSYEELRLCPPGDAAAWLDARHTHLGGPLPVNPSGGLLSKGEPLGASALGQVVELTSQLRGSAGPRQVDDARVALGHTVGRGANAGVTILTR